MIVDGETIYEVEASIRLEKVETGKEAVARRS
jgi:hypothetical protein